jgi:hypothetical protein
MRRAQKVAGQGRGRDRKTLASHSNQVRRRATGFKLELLEERRLLSGTTKVIPPTLAPDGLGAVYTGLSEQAHGIGSAPGLSTPDPSTGTTTTTTSPLTMADFEAYLKKLTATLPMNSGKTDPPSSSGLTSGPTSVNPGSGSDGCDGDNHGQNALVQQAYLWALQHDPSLVTGLSTPAVLPTAIFGFDGMNFLDSVNGYVPPDTNIAVGPNAVVEVVNAQIQVYDKATGAAQLPNTPLNTFFGQPTESPFDPMVTYDEIAGRFIVSSATFSGDLLVAVSKDSNPLDGFTSYDLNASEGGGFFGDYPKLGFNNDEVVITENMYSNSSGNFDHVQVLSFATSSLFAAKPPATLTLGTDYFSVDRNLNDFTLVPATMHGSKAGDPMYFVEENTYGDGANLRVVSATRLLSSSPAFTDTVIPVAAYTEPPAAQQPGGSIETNDSRILNVDYRDGLLVAGQNVGLSTDSDAHARWYELNVSGTPALAQQGTIAPAPGVSTYYPAIAIGAGDVIGMTYNQSSLSQYPSVYDTGRTTADLKGTMETPALAHAGTATYSDFTGSPPAGATTAASRWTRRRRAPSGAARNTRRRPSRAIRPTGPPGSPTSRSSPR